LLLTVSGVNEGVKIWGRKQKRMNDGKGEEEKDLLACLAEKGAGQGEAEAEAEADADEKMGPRCGCGCGSDRLEEHGSGRHGVKKTVGSRSTNE
jgi:hypothetical protein